MCLLYLSSGGSDWILVCVAAAQYDTLGTSLFADSQGSQLCQLDRKNRRSCATGGRTTAPSHTPTDALKHTGARLSLGLKTHTGKGWLSTSKWSDRWPWKRACARMWFEPTRKCACPGEGFELAAHVTPFRWETEVHNVLMNQTPVMALGIGTSGPPRPGAFLQGGWGKRWRCGGRLDASCSFIKLCILRR